MVAGMHLTFVYRPDVAYTWDSLDILKVHYMSHLGFIHFSGTYWRLCSILQVV